MSVSNPSARRSLELVLETSGNRSHRAKSSNEEIEPPQQGGLIFTAQTGPTLEQILDWLGPIMGEVDRLRAAEPIRVDAEAEVIGEFVEPLADDHLLPAADAVPLGRPPVFESMALAAGTAAMTSIGWFLVVSTVVRGHIRANFYVSLSIAVIGMVLTATVFVGAKEQER